MRQTLRASALVLVFLASGCGSSPEGEVSGGSEADGYSFILRGGGNIMNRSNNDGLSVTMGAHEVVVDSKSGKLKFDGKDAGTLSKGDKVTVDARGRLFVNGAAR